MTCGATMTVTHAALLEGPAEVTCSTEAGGAHYTQCDSDRREDLDRSTRPSRCLGVWPATARREDSVILERGVSEEKLANALDLDVKAIRRRRTMLAGICAEVTDLLKDKSINPTTFDVLRKMKPMRQIEAAELMNTAGNYAASYAKALLAATRQSDLIKSDQPKRVGGLTPEQMARMEREMEAVQQDLKSVESRYGDDVLHLVIACGYVSKLVKNREIKRHLTQHHAEIQAELVAIMSATSLDHSTEGDLE